MYPMNKTLTAETISESQIRRLRTESAQAGDMVQVDLCDVALSGDPEADGDDGDSSMDQVIDARSACADAINEARAAQTVYDDAVTARY